MTNIGRLNVIALDKESTRGTAETSTQAFSVTSANFRTIPTKINDEGSTWSIDDINVVDLGESHVEASIEGILKANTTTHIFNAALGAVTTTDNLDGTYTHEFTLANNNTHPSYTIFYDDNQVKEKATLGMLETFDISTAIENHITFTSSWMAKVVETTTDTPVFDQDEQNFISKQIEVFFADNVAGLDGATKSCVRSVNLSIAKNVMMDYCGALPQEIYNQQFGITWDFEMTYNNTDFKDFNIANTKKAVRFRITWTEIATGVNATIDIDIESVAFQDWDHSTDNNGIVTQTFGFTKEKWWNSNITINITNTLPTV